MGLIENNVLFSLGGAMNQTIINAKNPETDPENFSQELSHALGYPSLDEIPMVQKRLTFTATSMEMFICLKLN